MAVRPYIRTFDSNDYYHQLAAKEICLAIAWSSDYSVAQRARARGRHRRPPRLHAAQGGLEHHVQRLSDSGSAPHPQAAHEFLNFILDPEGHRRDHQRHSLRQRQSRGAALRPAKTSWTTRRFTPRRRCARNCTCRRHSAPTTTGSERESGLASKRASSSRPDRPFSAQNAGSATWRKLPCGLEMVTCAPI